MGDKFSLYCPLRICIWPIGKRYFCFLPQTLLPSISCGMVIIWTTSSWYGRTLGFRHSNVLLISILTIWIWHSLFPLIRFKMHFLDISLMGDKNKGVVFSPYRKNMSRNATLLATSCHPEHIIHWYLQGEIVPPVKSEWGVWLVEGSSLSGVGHQSSKN